VRSSRAIERRCREDVASRVITANQVPDHATIARFRVRHEAAIAELFGGVLELCAEAGLVQVGVVVVDGTRMAASAADRQTRGYEQIAKEILGEAAAIDAAEDELYGDGRGDELPPGFRNQGDRRTRLREAKQALQAKRAAAAKPVPRDRGQRLHECRRRLYEDWALERRVVADHAAWLEAGIASDGSRRMTGARHNIKPYPLSERPAGRINVTDPDSRTLKAPRGWVLGYNAQAVVTTSQIIVAAEVNTESIDKPNLQPMVHAACNELRAAGVDRVPEVVVADAGYWKTEAIEALVAQGIQTLVAPDADRREQPSPSRCGGLFDFMRRVLASDHGGQLYARRQAVIEPVFGQIKHNRGAERFQRRGRSAARSEWRLLAATHNILKLWRHTTAPATA
jgi:hypothetical protein